MGTTDKEKNKAYVAKHRAMKKATEEGKKEYNEINAGYIADHRKNLKTKIGEEEYKKQQREYMKQYRSKLKQAKQDIKATNAITIQSAIRNKLARKTLLKQKQEKEKQLNNATIKAFSGILSKNMVDEVFKNVLETIPIKRKVGRPKKSNN